MAAMREIIVLATSLFIADFEGDKIMSEYAID